MSNLAPFGEENLVHFGTMSRTNLCCFPKSFTSFLTSIFQVLVFKANPFWTQLAYFVAMSLLGFLALKVSNPRTPTSLSPYSDLDIFFTSVSAATVSSMSTVEMEAFSNFQLLIITILMLLGGEVFTSMLGLQLKRSRFLGRSNQTNHQNHHNPPTVSNSSDIELGSVVPHPPSGTNINISNSSDTEMLRHNSIRCLGYVVLGYLVSVHLVGSSLVALYIIFVPSAREVLSKKALPVRTFSVFTVVSTFANCGFVPTNENMIVFKKNSGLLLLLIPQILLGNTLYPPCLRFLIWVLEKATKRVEWSYILKNTEEMGYDHLLSGFHSFLLVDTVLGFVLVQLVLFCSFEWSSGAMDGLNGSYQKFVAALFQVVNSRHSGELVVDLSILSPAILVLFVAMMYLPPYTTFVSFTKQEEDHEDSISSPQSKRQRKSLVERLSVSPLSYLVIFIILICVTEREKLKKDPLNFNVLDVTIEVISAYGNVGFSAGYSCDRLLDESKTSCKNAWYGFAGRWSSKGKVILILVMFFGRLKKYTMDGGKAWKFS